MRYLHVYFNIETGDRNLKQRINIKFYVKISKCSIKMLQLLRVAYGENSLKKSNVFEWHNKFKDGSDESRSEQRKPTIMEFNF